MPLLRSSRRRAGGLCGLLSGRLRGGRLSRRSGLSGRGRLLGLLRRGRLGSGGRRLRGSRRVARGQGWLGRAAGLQGSRGCSMLPPRCHCSVCVHGRPLTAVLEAMQDHVQHPQCSGPTCSLVTSNRTTGATAPSVSAGAAAAAVARRRVVRVVAGVLSGSAFSAAARVKEAGQSIGGGQSVWGHQRRGSLRQLSAPGALTLAAADGGSRHSRVWPVAASVRARERVMRSVVGCIAAVLFERRSCGLSGGCRGLGGARQLLEALAGECQAGWECRRAPADPKFEVLCRRRAC